MKKCISVFILLVSIGFSDVIEKNGQMVYTIWPPSLAEYVKYVNDDPFVVGISNSEKALFKSKSNYFSNDSSLFISKIVNEHLWFSMYELKKMFRSRKSAIYVKVGRGYSYLQNTEKDSSIYHQFTDSLFGFHENYTITSIAFQYPLEIYAIFKDTVKTAIIDTLWLDAKQMKNDELHGALAVIFTTKKLGTSKVRNDLSPDRNAIYYDFDLDNSPDLIVYERENNSIFILGYYQKEWRVYDNYE